MALQYQEELASIAQPPNHRSVIAHDTFITIKQWQCYGRSFCFDSGFSRSYNDTVKRHELPFCHFLSLFFCLIDGADVHECTFR